ncbi:uncharacterized protein LOC126994066 [Eriocheir sinensis]|uniref:uncharacterized protein LOC126994066 n=1 Tax=Eriocheir sinensis TaxID=95602 RepID=UPI0021C81BD5|nr:uncharacterized protein LOC126994066 [Eriocheir sinensis]XP_050709266.1 uncharacterized protein LOC126994066 [Eriocheir sinensis]
MGAMRSSPVISLHAESGIAPLATHRREVLCHHYHRIRSLPPSHPLSKMYSTSGVDQHAQVWLPGARQPLIVRALLVHHILRLTPPPPQPISPHSPIPPWLDISHMVSLHMPGLPPKPSSSIVAASHFLQMDKSLYHHHLKICTDGSHSPSPPSTASAIYDPGTTICRTWRLPPETDVLTAELYALHQALTHLHTTHSRDKAVVFTDSLSSLHLILSRHPTSSTALAHTIQRALLILTSEGWEITLQWVPSHSGIRGNVIADAAAKLALADVNITPLPLPLSTAKRLISRTCHSTWDDTLHDTLRITSTGQYRTDPSPQPWVRKTSRVLDVALTCLRLGHTRLGAHLHRLRLVPDPHCPWCRTVEDTIEHLLPHCPRHHSQRVLFRHQLRALDVPTFDLLTLLAAAGVHPSRQEAVIRLTCAFLRKTGQLTRL